MPGDRALPRLVRADLLYISSIFCRLCVVDGNRVVPQTILMLAVADNADELQTVKYYSETVRSFRTIEVSKYALTYNLNQ